jgi:hypothetical protein
MSDLQGPPAELRFTITIKRAATGQEETYEMIGTPVQEQQQETQDGSNSLDSGA